MISRRVIKPTPLLQEVSLSMPRLTPSEEVQVLRFFEQAPYDKAETMLHIVCEKMRERKPALVRDERSPGRKTIKRARASPAEATEEAPSGTLGG